MGVWQMCTRPGKTLLSRDRFTIIGNECRVLAVNLKPWVKWFALKKYSLFCHLHTFPGINIIEVKIVKQKA